MFRDSFIEEILEEVDIFRTICEDQEEVIFG